MYCICLQYTPTVRYYLHTHFLYRRTYMKFPPLDSNLWESDSTLQSTSKNAYTLIWLELRWIYIYSVVVLNIIDMNVSDDMINFSLLFSITNLLEIINYSLNFYIYCYYNKDIRTSCRQMFQNIRTSCRQRCQNIRIKCFAFGR